MTKSSMNLERGTEMRVIANSNGHGFSIGQVVVLDHYDIDGDAIFQPIGGGQGWWMVEVDLEPVTELHPGVHRALAANIIDRAQAIGRLVPSDLNRLNIHELDYQIEDVYTALVRAGRIADPEIEPDDD